MYMASQVAIYIGPTRPSSGYVDNVYPEGATEGTVVDLSRPELMAIHMRQIELGLDDDAKGRGSTVNYLAVRNGNEDEIPDLQRKAA